MRCKCSFADADLPIKKYSVVWFSLPAGAMEIVRKSSLTGVQLAMLLSSLKHEHEP